MRYGAVLRGLLLVCLARGYVLVDAVPRQEAVPGTSARHRAPALWGQGGWAPRAPLHLRGGEREGVREGHVGKKGATGRGDGKKKDKRKRRGASASDEHGGPAAAAVLQPSAEAAAASSATAGQAGSGGDSGAAEGHEGDGKAHEGTVGTGPNMFFGRDFGGDFPNRERVDELYREAAVFMDEHEQGSSELEESSGDGQGNNPFEVCVTLWCAGQCA